MSTKNIHQHHSFYKRYNTAISGNRAYFIPEGFEPLGGEIKEIHEFHHDEHMSFIIVSKRDEDVRYRRLDKIVARDIANKFLSKIEKKHLEIPHPRELAIARQQIKLIHDEIFKARAVFQNCSRGHDLTIPDYIYVV